MLYSTVVSNYVCRGYVCLLYISSTEYLIFNICSLNYTWINQDRKSVNLPAPTYIDYVMTWVQNLLDDENVFPTKSGASQFGIVEK